MRNKFEHVFFSSLGQKSFRSLLQSINTSTNNRSLRLLDDQRCVYVFVLRKRAVAQPLEPLWWKSRLQARSLRPQRHNVFHVRDRARLQLFMSSPLFQTEDPEKSPTKILLSY
ncbi:hypothetical protein LDENG_00141730 [Lucifuga dentata]|nr:hypothetical protein LDENG_00141730 [Lucifuga dentata]